MSTTMWQDDLDSDAEAYDDSEAGEDLGEELGEDLDSEALSRTERQRRARQRRIALARRRQVQARTPARPPVARPVPSSQQTIAAVRSLDLETKVQEDAFRSALARQGSRMNRAEYAAVLGAATNQFIESFDAPGNVYAKAALRFSPLLLLSPQRRGQGFDAFVRDPRVLGAAAVLAITFAGDNRSRFTAARSVGLTFGSQMQANETQRIYADARDSRGRSVGAEVSWESDNSTVLTVDKKGSNVAEVIARSPGRAVLTAKTDEGVLERATIVVSAAPAAATTSSSSSGGSGASGGSSSGGSGGGSSSGGSGGGSGSSSGGGSK